MSGIPPVFDIAIGLNPQCKEHSGPVLNLPQLDRHLAYISLKYDLRPMLKDT